MRDLACGRSQAAARTFAEAAARWRTRTLGGFVRCRWAEGEARRRAGESRAAVAVLLEGERFARRHGYAGEIARIARALRLCGVHRSVRRRRSDNGLTGREREVLLLVGQGLSNQEIARRLGVGRPTVARIVQSAARKLGAETRAQAAALAAQA